MREKDSLHRFLFERLAIRGVCAQLDDTWQQVLARRDYPLPVRDLLGEALAAAALLHATIKFDGVMTLQAQGKGPLSLLVAQCTSEGELRGVARCRSETVAEATHSAGEVAPGLGQLLGEGNLVMTLEPRSGGERYQGVVALEGNNLAVALQAYFERSEQLPTQVHLTADGSAAAGLLLQRLPEDSPDLDGWNRVQHLGATATADELRRLDCGTLIHRLFAEEDVRLFTAKRLSFGCLCSQTRTENMLLALGEREVREILAEQGEVRVACEFCGESYPFDAVDVGRVFAAVPQPPVPPTRH